MKLSYVGGPLLLAHLRIVPLLAAGAPQELLKDPSDVAHTLLAQVAQLPESNEFCQRVWHGCNRNNYTAEKICAQEAVQKLMGQKVMPIQVAFVISLAYKNLQFPSFSPQEEIMSITRSLLRDYPDELKSFEESGLFKEIASHSISPALVNIQKQLSGIWGRGHK